jgi:uncharacterized phage protein (TIGR02220 family)
MFVEKRLIKERPLVILPSLAMKIGFQEAAILQQIHFWLTASLHIIEERRWVYNTYKDWQKQFPFWSECTIKRSILNLEEQGLLISGNWNLLKLDKTKWYTIDYEKIRQLELPLFEPSNVSSEQCLGSRTASTGQNACSKVSASNTDGTVQTRAIPKSTSKNTSKKEIPIVDIIDYLNQKTRSAYKPTTEKTKKVIRARISEGFTLADFKKVIDLKTSEWLDDPHWSRYLRPETLFGTKFESYLNQKGFKKKMMEEDLNLDD